MKKIIVFMLLLFMLCSCKSNNDLIIQDTKGNMIAINHNYNCVCISKEYINNKCIVTITYEIEDLLK
jgi:uncharacterized protein YcfL